MTSTDRPTPDDARDPRFDGHLEKPLEKMTVRERLDWLSQAALLLHAGRRMRQGDDTQPKPPRES